MDYFLEEAEIEMRKAVLVAEFYEDMEALNIKETENKAFMGDGGSFNSFCTYFEATDGSAEKKEGVIKRVWGAILNLCKKIKEFLTRKKNRKVDPNQKIAVDKNRREIRIKIIVFFKKWKNALAHPVSNPKAFAKAVGPLVALVTAILALKVTKGKKGSSEKKKETKKQDKKEEVKPAPGEVVVPAAEMESHKVSLTKEVVGTVEQAGKEIMDATGNSNLTPSLTEAQKKISQIISVTKAEIEAIDKELAKYENELNKRRDLMSKAEDDWNDKADKLEREIVKKEMKPEELSAKDKQTLKQHRKYIHKYEARNKEAFSLQHKIYDLKDKIREIEIEAKGKDPTKRGELFGELLKLKKEIDRLYKEHEKLAKRQLRTPKLSDRHRNNLADPETRKNVREAQKKYDDLRNQTKILENKIENLKKKKMIVDGHKEAQISKIKAEYDTQFKK